MSPDVVALWLGGQGRVFGVGVGCSGWGSGVRGGGRVFGVGGQAQHSGMEAGWGD